MVPLQLKVPDWVRVSDDAPHRSTAFRHATLHQRPGLWGDQAERPTSALWLREGSAGTWEAFGAGRASPSIEWLDGRSAGRPISLLAPPSWEGPVRLLGGRVETRTIRTMTRPESAAPPITSHKIRARPLTLADRAAFVAAAPSWALRSWGDFAAMLAVGAAFGVPDSGGFASLSWTYESDQDHDKIGVSTKPRFRRLGLGRAAASALVEAIIRERRKSPLWVTTPENSASLALAETLGFAAEVDETLLCWTREPG